MGWSRRVSIGGVAVGFVVGVFAFSALGVLIASLAPRPVQRQGVGLLIWFIMLFVSGTSAPLDELPRLDGGPRQVAAALPHRDRFVDPMERVRRQPAASDDRGWHRPGPTLLAAALFRWDSAAT